MKRRPISLVLFCMTFVLGTVEAGPLLPEPGEPWVRRAPSRSSWILELSSSLEKEKKAELPAGPGEGLVRISVQKDGSVIREEVSGRSGETTERWILGEQEFVKRNGQFLHVPPTDEGTDYFDYQKSDFPHLDWLEKRYYWGAANYEGTAVYLFVREEPKPGDALDLPAVMARCLKEKLPFVLLSGKQLPLLSFDGRQVGRFSEFTPLKARLVPPAALQGMSAQLEKDLKAHRYKPSPP